VPSAGSFKHHVPVLRVVVAEHKLPAPPTRRVRSASERSQISAYALRNLQHLERLPEQFLPALWDGRIVRCHLARHPANVIKEARPAQKVQSLTEVEHGVNSVLHRDSYSSNRIEE